MTTTRQLQPPGPGGWDLDRTHYPGGTTSISQVLLTGAAVGMRKAFGELGMPAETLDVRFVDGFMYTRLRPLIRPDKPATRLPPAALLKLAVRLHPEMRRRARTAERALAERPWRRVVQEWEQEIRPRLERRNAELLAIDETTLDDVALARHIESLFAYCRETYELHFYLHAFDLGPIGLLLADCARWGISAEEVVPALAGASPSTTAPALALSKLRRLIAASGARPTTLDDVRGISAEAGALLDEFMTLRGRMMVTRYDLDGRTLEEQPGVVLAAILRGSDPGADEARAAAVAAELRSRVPTDEQAVFDDKLAEARATMDLRDDNGPNTIELPVGLLRHALLEAGARFAERGTVADPRHVFELEIDEVGALLRGGPGPSSDQIRERAAARRAASMIEPPAHLGPDEPTPPLHVLAPPHQKLVAAVQRVLEHMGMSSTATAAASPLHGAGVGTATYRGRARVADSPEAALDAMEPGDVLVVRFTTPAFNTVLSLAGAVVTASGALLSHAAVMARELGIPAVIGAPGALEIPDGAEVEVDPVAGRVRVVAVV